LIVLLTCLGIALGQFDFGGTAKPQAPPKLALLLSINRIHGQDVELDISLKNVGGGFIDIDSATLNGELLRVRFTDREGKEIRFNGDRLLSFVPFDPDRRISLYGGSHYGITQVFHLAARPAGSHVQATASYPDPKKVFRIKDATVAIKNLWFGTIKSNILAISRRKR
jgi:hypothetical protein